MSALDFRQDLRILTLFLIVQFSGLLLTIQLYNGSVQQLSTSIGAPSLTFPFAYTIFIIIFSIAMLIMIRRGIGKVMIWLESFVILTTSYLFLVIIVSILGSYFPSISWFGNSLYQTIAGTVFALCILVIKNRVPRSRNPVSLMSSIAIGMAVGLSLSFPVAFIFMIIIAIYDFIAVFITKHMIAMGQAAVENNLAFLIMSNEGEAIPKGKLTKTQSALFTKQQSAFEKNYKGTVRQLNNDGLVPVIRPRALGNGDLAIPLMLAVSAYSQYLNFTVSFVIVIGAMVGLIATFYILEKYKRPLPAIPPLLLGISLALFVYFIVL